MSIYYHHIRNKSNPGKGGMTIAFQESMQDCYVYAVARCNPLDNFCKSVGRIKAKGRLNSFRYIKWINASSRKEFIKKVTEKEYKGV